MSRRRRRKRSRRLPLLALLVLPLVALGVWLAWPGDEDERWKAEEQAAYAALRDGNSDQARIHLSRLIEKNPDSSRLRQNLCVVLLDLGRLEEAESQALATLEMRDDFAPAHAVVAEVRRRLQDWESAIRHARLATRGLQVPDDAQVRLAMTMLDAGMTSEGTLALARAVERGMGGEEAAVRLASLLGSAEVGSNAEARARRGIEAALERAEADLHGDPAEPTKLGRYVSLAMASGDPKAAAAALIAAKAVRELTLRESAVLSRALAETGRPARAREVMEEASGGSEDQPTYRTPLEEAKAWITLRDPERALAVLDTIAPESPTRTAALRLRLAALGMLVSIRGEAALVDEIEKTAGEILAARPLDEAAREQRARARLARGDWPGALADAISLRRAAPASPSGKWLHGLALLASGRAGSALPLMLEGRAAAGSEEAAARRILGAALYAGDQETASAEALRLTAENTTALRAAAAALAENVGPAGTLARSPAFSSCPLEERALACRLLAAAGDAGPAKKLIQKIEERDPTAAAAVLIGDLRAASGDTEGARASFVRAIGLPGAIPPPTLQRIGRTILAAKDPDQGVMARIRERLAAGPNGEMQVRLFAAREALAEGRADDAVAGATACLDAPGEDPIALELLLESLVAAGADPERVAEAAERVIAVVPGNRLARAVRAEHLFRDAMKEASAHNRSAVEEKLAEVIDLAPASIAPFCFRALSRVSNGDLEAAEEDARLLAGRPGTGPMGHFLLGIVRYVDARYDEAAEEFETSLKTGGRNPRVLAGLAASRLAGGKPGAALAAARECAALDKTGRGAIQVEVAALLVLRRGDEAATRLEERIGAEPGDAALRLLLARTLMSVGRHGEAATVCEEMTERWPALPAAWDNLVIARFRGGDAEAARAAADTAVADPATHLDGLLIRSRLLWFSGDRDAAVADLRTAVREAPGRAETVAALGERLMSLGRDREARPHLERAAQLAPRSFQVQILLGLLAQREGLPERAEEHYEEALRLSPGDTVASNNLAVLLLARPGTRHRALELARRSASAAPGNGQFHDTLAMALEANLMTAEAVPEAEAALRMCPDDADVAVNAARIFCSAGLTDRARDAAAKALAAAGEEEMARIEQKLNEILSGLPR